MLVVKRAKRASPLLLQPPNRFVLPTSMPVRTLNRPGRVAATSSSAAARSALITTLQRAEMPWAYRSLVGTYVATQRGLIAVHSDLVSPR